MPVTPSPVDSQSIVDQWQSINPGVTHMQALHMAKKRVLIETIGFGIEYIVHVPALLEFLSSYIGFDLYAFFKVRSYSIANAYALFTHETVGSSTNI
jgi:hypothetical protein